MLGTAYAVLRSLASLSLLVATPGATYADTDLRPGIMGEDDRKPVAAKGPPWTAIGQVNISGYRNRQSCTGTLISPRVVLTAAHCVIDPRTKKPFSPDAIHFSAGVRLDTALGHSVAQCLKLPDSLRDGNSERVLSGLPSKRGPLDKTVLELAVIVLADVIPDAAVAPILQDDPFYSGLPLVHASYPIDRRYMLTADATCTALDRDNGFWLTDCDTQAGSAGGPILISDGGEMKVVAIVVGWIRGIATLAVPVQRPAMTADADCP